MINKASNITNLLTNVSAGNKDGFISNLDKKQTNSTKFMDFMNTGTKMKQKDFAKPTQGNANKENVYATNTSNTKQIKTTNNNAEKNQLHSVDEIEQKIRTAIMDKLGMSNEELDEALMTMNLNVLQLLDPTQLQQFAMQVQQIDATGLLMNDEIGLQMKQLMEEVANIVQDLGIEPDEFDIWLNETLNAEETFNSLDDTQTTKSNLVEESNLQNNSVSDVVEELHPNQVQDIESNDDMQQEHNLKETATVSIQVDDQRENHPMEQNQSDQQTKDSQTNLQQNFLQNLNQSMDHVSTNDFSDTIVQDNRQLDIVNQILEQVKVVLNQNETSMDIQLNPQTLGKVQIQVVNREGVMSAQITAETEMAKTAIENHIQELKDSFQNQNLKVESIEVSVSTSSFENSQEQGQASQGQSSHKSKHNIDLSQLEFTEDLTPEEVLEAQMLEAQGSSVSYMA